MALVIGTNCGFVVTAPTADPGGTGSNFDLLAHALKGTAPQGATRAVEVGWWCDNATQAANWEAGFYTDAGANEPELRTQVTAEQAKGTGSGWKSVAVSWTLVPGGTGWMAVQLDDTATATQIDIDSAGAGSIAVLVGVTALPADWGTSTTTDQTAATAIYCVYRTSRVIKRRHR